MKNKNKIGLVVFVILTMAVFSSSAYAKSCSGGGGYASTVAEEEAVK